MNRDLIKGDKLAQIYRIDGEKVETTKQLENQVENLHSARAQKAQLSKLSFPEPDAKERLLVEPAPGLVNGFLKLFVSQEAVNKAQAKCQAYDSHSSNCSKIDDQIKQLKADDDALRTKLWNLSQKERTLYGELQGFSYQESSFMADKGWELGRLKELKSSLEDSLALIAGAKAGSNIDEAFETFLNQSLHQAENESSYELADFALNANF
jgi:hypothetical protein